MKFIITISPHMTIEVEADSVKDYFNKIANPVEILKDTQCGCCGSHETMPRIRTATVGKKEYTYYEIICTECWAKLELGQRQDDDTVLFPKRKKDEKGNDIERIGKNRGWYKWGKGGEPVVTKNDEPEDGDIPF